MSNPEIVFALVKGGLCAAAFVYTLVLLAQEA